MVPISWGDEIEIDLIPAGISFTCSEPSLTDASENLATHAAALYLKHFRLVHGVRIHLDKRIPIGAGLGGGSSNAGSVLLALRELCDVKCDDAELRHLAAQLGSDVPFFIDQTPAVCRGRGEIIEPIAVPETIQGLLVHPGFGVSTPWSYKAYAADPGQGEVGKRMGSFTLRNDLERPAFGKYPWLPTAKSWFREQPEVEDSLMSGSGSSLFALTRTLDSVEGLKKRFTTEFGNLFAVPFTLHPHTMPEGYLAV